MYSYLCIIKFLHMIATIDIGNSRIKYAVFEGNNLLEADFFLKENFKKGIEIILKKYSKLEALVISSVGEIEKKDFDIFQKRINLYYITKDLLFPFQNQYQTPNTLGIDRMVLAAGAVIQFPNKNALIIDSGTCITYDYVSENKIYLGGAISLGIELRYKALHSYTAKLPLLTNELPEKVIGNSTNQSIHSGVVNGIIFEIEGFINAIKHQNENFIIILTGGDANFLAKRLKNTIFANSNFLLESLNNLYQYQND